MGIAAGALFGAGVGALSDDGEGPGAGAEFLVGGFLGAVFGGLLIPVGYGLLRWCRYQRQVKILRAGWKNGAGSL